MAKKTITTDDAEFKKIREATNELSAMMCEYIANKGFNIPHGLTVMAGATLGVIESVCDVIGENPDTMIDVYIGGLRDGMTNEIKQKEL